MSAVKMNCIQIIVST